MKKTIRFVAFCLVLVVCALGFSSCRGEVESTVGSSFTMPISGEVSQFINITDFEMEWRDADIENLDDYDYQEKTNDYSFGKYVYTVRISGHVDQSFAGERLRISFSLEEPYEVSESCFVTLDIDNEGNFSFEEDILHTNREFIYVTPNRVWALLEF